MEETITIVPRNEIEDNPHFIALNAIILASLQMSCMDKLNDTTFYRHDVKSYGNLFIKALIKMLNKELPPVDEGDNGTFYELMD